MKSGGRLRLVCSVLFVTRLLSQPAFAQQVTPTPWTIAAPMPGASSRLQAAYIPETGKVYAISGFATNRVGIYDPAKNSWTTGTPLPSDLPSPERLLNGFVEKFGQMVARGKIFIFGGDDRFGTHASPRDTTFIYTPASDTAGDSWAKGKSMPTARAGVAVAAVNDKTNRHNKIYVIGGKNRMGKALPTVEIYDSSLNTWDSTQPQLPAPRTAAAVGAINGRIYLFGGDDVDGQPLRNGLVFDPGDPSAGWLPVDADMPLDGSNRSTVVNKKLFIVGCKAPDPSTERNKVLVFDPNSGWDTTYSDLPTGRPDGGVTSGGSQVYYIGGGLNAPLDELDILDIGAASAPVITNPTDLDILATNEVFDPPVSKTWASKVRMPTARAAFGIAEADGKIYVGGGQLIRQCTPAVGNLEAYVPNPDPAKPGSWTILPPMPTPRLHVSAATVNGIIYFIGGHLNGGQGQCEGDAPVGTVEFYDPIKLSQPDAWTTLPVTWSKPRYGTGVGVNTNGKIYVVGGNDGSGAVGTLEVFDPQANTWTPKASLKTPRLFPAVAVVNNVLYAIGGSNSNGSKSDTVEAYDLTSDNGWVDKAPIPTARRFRAGVGVINNIIYVFGGASRFRGLSANEAYDPSKDQGATPNPEAWSVAPAMPTARYGLGGAVVGDRLYAIGGLSQGIATVGQKFIYQITASNHPTFYDIVPGIPGTTLPGWLQIDHASGILYGIPDTPSHDNLLTVTATANGITGAAPLFFSVQPSPGPGPSTPQIVSSTSATGKTSVSCVVDRQFSFQVLAKSVSSSALYNAGGLPSGLSIDPNTGLISGCTSAEGNFAVSVSVTDPGFVGSPDLQTTNSILQLTFIEDSDGPIITSPESATLVPGESFSYKITADKTASIFYIGIDGKKNGALPSGLTFDGVDTISGTYNGGAPGSLFPQRETDWTNASIRPTSGSIGLPDTITIRPRLGIQTVATDSSGTGTRPLNFATP